jgi:DNA-directed RNA polymerase specialized sigma24 family protein
MPGVRMDQLSDNEIREYGKMISILANRMISNKDVAQEAAQEVWVEVLGGLSSLDNPDNWLTELQAPLKKA